MSDPLSVAPPTADFGSRFSAFIVDAVILFAVQWIAVIVLARQLQAVGLTKLEPCEANAERMCEGPSTLLWAVVLVFLLATTVGYHAFFEGRYGATPGKKWMGLRVRSIDGSTPLGLGTATLRAVPRQAFWLSLFFVFDASPLGLSLPSVLFIALPLAALGLIASAAVVADGRGAHDRIAGTQVVRAEHDPSPPASHRSSGAPNADDQDTLTLDDNSEESV